MADEYFIRGPEEETAQGPFTLDALLTLAEAGKVTREHYYFDSSMESWVLIRTNEALCEDIFPEKKTLTLRKKTIEEIDSINIESEEDAPVQIEEMLAAAEGHTAETKHVRSKKEWEERTAGLAVPILGTLLLISALSVIYPSWHIIRNIMDETEGAWFAVIRQPFLLLGLFDLLMGAFLFLNATEIFPVIRFRAMLGAGFFSILYAAGWINGDPHGLMLAFASLNFGFGLYCCTITLNFTVMTLAATAGFAGALGLNWYNNIMPLLYG